jgi:hypothetical protein
MAKQHYKPTTLDGLAIMINHGFTEPRKYIDKRLDEIHGNMATKGELKGVRQRMKDKLRNSTPPMRMCAISATPSTC